MILYTLPAVEPIIQLHDSLSLSHLRTVLRRLNGLVTSNQYWLHELHHSSDTFNFIFFISAQRFRLNYQCWIN